VSARRPSALLSAGGYVRSFSTRLLLLIDSTDGVPRYRLIGPLSLGARRLKTDASFSRGPSWGHRILFRRHAANCPNSDDYRKI